MAELLIVEDDGAILHTLREFLEQEGFGVCCAPGQAAGKHLGHCRGFCQRQYTEKSKKDFEGF